MPRPPNNLLAIWPLAIWLHLQCPQQRGSRDSQSHEHKRLPTERSPLTENPATDPQLKDRAGFVLNRLASRKKGGERIGTSDRNLALQWQAKEKHRAETRFGAQVDRAMMFLDHNVGNNRQSLSGACARGFVVKSGS
jgi:hypothetical protein